MTLDGFLCVTKISNGLQNIQDLKLFLSDLESIYDFNLGRSLRKLSFFTCSKLKEIPWFTEESVITSLIRDQQSQCELMSFDILIYCELNMSKLMTRHLQGLHIMCSYWN